MIALLLNQIRCMVKRFSTRVCDQIPVFDAQSTPRRIEHGDVNGNDHILLQDSGTAWSKDRRLELDHTDAVDTGVKEVLSQPGSIDDLSANGFHLPAFHARA